MAYSAEVVRRARAHLAQAKEDRESENRQHLAEAYRRVPRIKEIDMQLRLTMAKAAQAAFLQGSDGRSEMEKVKEKNLQLQRERSLLAASHFEEGFLVSKKDGSATPFFSNVTAKNRFPIYAKYHSNDQIERVSASDIEFRISMKTMSVTTNQ